MSPESSRQFFKIFASTTPKAVPCTQTDISQTHVSYPLIIQESSFEILHPGKCAASTVHTYHALHPAPVSRSFLRGIRTLCCAQSPHDRVSIKPLLALTQPRILRIPRPLHHEPKMGRLRLPRSAALRAELQPSTHAVKTFVSHTLRVFKQP